MNGGDRIRRGWTHRRLGLGAARPSNPQLASTEALLTAVGARRLTPSPAEADPLAAALLELVCDVDLAAGIGHRDAMPLPPGLLRLPNTEERSRPRLGWRVLIPATSGGIAALVVALTLLLGRGSSAIVTPAATATAESHQLLRHARTLLSAATAAHPAERSQLLSEARADLDHVSRLLPLTPSTDRPAIRQQLHVLEQRVPATPSPVASTDSGDRSLTSTTTSGQRGTSGTSSGVTLGTTGNGRPTTVPTPVVPTSVGSAAPVGIHRPPPFRGADPVSTTSPGTGSAAGSATGSSSTGAGGAGSGQPGTSTSGASAGTGTGTGSGTGAGSGSDGTQQGTHPSGPTNPYRPPRGDQPPADSPVGQSGSTYQS